MKVVDHRLLLFVAAWLNSDLVYVMVILEILVSHLPRGSVTVAC